MPETPKKTSLITPIMTASYPNLFKAQLSRDAKPGDEPKFGVGLLGTAEAVASPEFKALQVAVVAAVKEKFGDKFKWQVRNGVMVDAGGTVHSPFHLIEDDEEGKYPAEYVVRFNASAGTTKPRIISAYKDANGKAQDVTDERLVYPGCHVRASLNVSAYDNPKRKGVGIYLSNVMLVNSEAPRIDSRRSADDEFGGLLQDGKIGAAVEEVDL